MRSVTQPRVLVPILFAMAAFASGCDKPASQQTSTSSSARAPATQASTAAAGSEVKKSEKKQGVAPDANMARSAIADAYKWKLDALFPNDDAFETNLSKAAEDRKKLSGFIGKLGSPKQLLECLKLYFDTRLLTNKLTLYANLRFDSYQKDTQLQAMNERALQAMNDLIAAASFIRQEVLQLDDAAIQKAFTDEAELQTFKPYISELRRRKAHVLNPEAERVLTLAGDNLWAEIDLNELPSDHEKTFKSLLGDVPLPTIKDEKGEPVRLTLASFGKYRASTDRRVRKEAVDGLFSTLATYQHGFASTLAGQVRFNVMLARARGYQTALDAYLDKDNISPDVYRNLITTINKNLAPLHRYVRLRKQVMGLDKIYLYDLYTPLVADVDMDMPYEQGRQLLSKALAPLGKEYVAALEKGIDPQNGWVDVYPHENKSSGAFSASVYGVHPFLKLNYFDSVDDLSTVAHEFGHALHSDLAMNTQPYVTANYSMFNAEIASTVNEKLLSDYLIANAKSDDETLSLLNELVETLRTTIYRQTLFAEFELAIHTEAEKGTPLTSELLKKTYETLIRRYYGPDYTLGENDDMEWAYIPHFYYKYYVFTYATGLSSAVALADRIEKMGEPAQQAYLGMLKAGSSKPPLELLKDAGVDLTKPDAIEGAAKLLDTTLGRMEELLKKTGKLK